MEPIHPLKEENLDQFRGQLVCVIMKDGTRHIGVLGGCRGGRLVLNEDAPEAYGSVAGQRDEEEGKRRPRRRAGGRKGRGRSAGKTAQATAFASGGWYGPHVPYDGPFSGGFRPPYGYFGPRTLLDLALIALVLLIL